MSHKLLPLVLMGGLAVGGCATPYSTVASRHADTEDYRPYHEYPSPAGYTTAPATERVDALDRAIREVAEAPDIDAAIDAYSFGLTLDRSSVRLHKTYLRRMVDLGVPHLASGAAAKVVDAEPDAPLARAVLAYSAGRDGLMVDALTDITIAAKRSPEDPFVQRTSGHLLAWYDNNPRPPGLPSTVRFALQTMHETLDDQRVFADAYNDAADYYHDRQMAMARGPTTGPASTQPAVANGPDTLPPDEVPSYAGGGGYGGPIAPPPIYEPYGPAYSPYYDQPYAFAPAFYDWGPGFFIGSAFFLDFANFHHRHDHDRDRHRDHSGTGSRGGVARGGTGTTGTMGTGGRHLSVAGRSGVYLPPPAIGPRGVGSAAGRLLGLPSASVTGGFDRLNTGRTNSGFGSSISRFNGYRARGPSDSALHGFAGSRSEGFHSFGASSQDFTGSTFGMQAPTGNVSMAPAPAPVVVPSAPAPSAGRSGGGSRGSSGGSSGGGGHGSSGGSGRR